MAAHRAPFDPTDPDLLTPEQRLDELAAPSPPAPESRTVMDDCSGGQEDL